MRLGVSLSTDGTLDQLGDGFADVAARGFDSVWIPNIFGVDALTGIAAIGNRGPGIEIGTAVIPTYPRHPIMLASQALTTQAAIGNRLALGIGLSHQVVIENMFGYSFEKPARHMKEYLQALIPLLEGQSVAVQGETLKAMGQVAVKGAERPPVLLAALAPVMLKLAGAVADGTVTWMTGPATIEDHIAPHINSAAETAGKPAPRIVASVPVLVTDDPDGARDRASQVFVVYGQLPSYRAMLDKEGAGGPADVALVGDEATVRKGIDRMRDAGTTEFVAVPFGNREENARTLEVVKG